MKKRVREKLKIIFISVCALVFLVFLFLILSRVLPQGRAIEDLEKNNVTAEDFAKCLNQSGVKMYGAYWCSHCQNQKSMFGDNFKYVNYVECTSQVDLCSAKGIGGYPTWEINGSFYPGEQDLAKISELSGCEI